ncbi:MAG: helix-turn-helix transcriptional regulator [Candidatus Thermoplasmatota archaeon]|jgi:PadR family transcriptional regulator, regulatory protein PadR|nr:helix-turn-helix transcriptional regulator [Candidatus Thermoplasmatota archaeon]
MYEQKILLGFIRVHILHHAATDPQGIYGTAMREELKRHGYNISPGTLYPILHEMMNNGLLTSKPIIVNGKQRKIYHATQKGRETLTILKQSIKELSNEVI